MLVATITGCGGGWQSGLIRTAAFEHDCNDEDVHILEVLRPAAGRPRAVRLDVCGDERIYRNTVSGWLDFTHAVRSDDGDAAGSAPTEHRSDADMRALLRELNPQVMACTHDTPLSPHLTLDTNGHLIEVTGLPADAAQQSCLRAVFARVEVPGEAAPVSFTAHFAPGSSAEGAP